MTDLYFSLQVPACIYIILGVALVLAVWVCWRYAGMCRRVARAVRRDTADSALSSGPLFDKTQDDGHVSLSADGEPVSVIIRARDEAERLAELLPAILGQEYEPGFEVIVVNEGASEPTMRIVDTMRATHSNLYVTFTPDRSLNLSSKKLAVTLGVKAARNRIVVLTTANAVIGSRRWLQRMVAHFADPAVEVVLGYAGPRIAEDSGRGRRMRAFNHVETAVAWLSAALTRKPVRGTEFNMAFTTDAFFRNKGFSRSLNLRDGVDDIFVSEIATPDNTAVELARPAMVTCSHYDPVGAMRHDRCSHLFTGRFVRRDASRLLNAGPIVMTAVTVLAVWAGVAAFPNIAPLAVAGAIVLGMLIVTVLSWRAAMLALNSRRLLLTLPWMLFTRPLRALFFALSARRHNERNYTYRF